MSIPKYDKVITEFTVILMCVVIFFKVATGVQQKSKHQSFKYPRVLWERL